MPKAEVQKTFHVPLEKVTEYFSNQEVYSKQHSRSDTTRTILSQGNNEILAEVKQQVGERTIVYTTKTVYRLPQSIEIETLSGLAKGSRQKVTLESAPEGTKVTYFIDFKFELSGIAGKAARLVSGKMIKKATRESLEELAEEDRKYLEGEPLQPPSPD